MGAFEETAVYYLLSPGEEKEHGPYSLLQLREMWKAGTITGQTLFATKGMQNWAELRTMREKMEEKRKISCDHCGYLFEGLTDVPLLSQRCPICKNTPVKIGKTPTAASIPATLSVEASSPSSMSIIGIVFLVLGLLGILYFGLVFDTSVANEGISGDRPSRVVNIGLSNDRLVGTVASSAFAVMGTILLTVDAIVGRVERVARKAKA